MQGENINPASNCMSRIGVAATVRVEPDVCFPPPHRHASGHRLTGQWAIPFITWKKPVTRLAAAQRLEQRQRGGDDADGAGLGPNIAKRPRWSCLCDCDTQKQPFCVQINSRKGFEKNLASQMIHIRKGINGLFINRQTILKQGYYLATTNNN